MATCYIFMLVHRGNDTITNFKIDNLDKNVFQKFMRNIFIIPQKRLLLVVDPYLAVHMLIKRAK